MELDKQVLAVICAAILSMVGLSGYFLAPAGPPRAAHERPLYAPDDIRYKYQQEALRHPKKAKPEAAESSIPEFSKSGKPKHNKTVSAGGGSDDSSSENDDGTGEPNEELSEHEPQEEPPLD